MFYEGGGCWCFHCNIKERCVCVGGSIRAEKLNPSMRNKWIKKTYFAVINDFYIIKRSNNNNHFCRSQQIKSFPHFLLVSFSIVCLIRNRNCFKDLLINLTIVTIFKFLWSLIIDSNINLRYTCQFKGAFWFIS